jgi:hypothetical protein
MVKGLGTVIYSVPDLNRAKGWYASAFQQKPYFDQPFYVGFNIAGYELGLDPNPTLGKPGRGGSVAYWRVENIENAVQHFVAAGAHYCCACSRRRRRNQGRHSYRSLRQLNRPYRESAFRVAKNMNVPCEIAV